MDLTLALAKTPLRWTLQAAEEVVPGRSARPSMLLTVRPRRGVKALSRHFRPDCGLSVEHMLAVLMKTQLPDNPVLRAWLLSRGNVPVELQLESLDDLAPAMHTGLRKLADSKQSIITWNALHHLHAQDRGAFWDAARQVVEAAFAARRPPTRRTLAQALQQRLVELDYESGERRSPEEEFARRALHAGCALTGIDEWMWGWLGYVVKDREVE